MPEPPTQKGIEHNSLPLPPSWAETIKLKGYWAEKDAEDKAKRQLEACELEEVLENYDPRTVHEMEADEFEQDWLPGYDITDDHE